MNIIPILKQKRNVPMNIILSSNEHLKRKDLPMNSIPIGDSNVHWKGPFSSVLK